MEGEEKEKKDAGPATRLDIPFRRERDEIRKWRCSRESRKEDSGRQAERDARDEEWMYVSREERWQER